MKRLLLIPILALAALTAGCSDVDTPKVEPNNLPNLPSDKVQREWRRTDTDISEEWSFVCPVTGRLDGAQISLYKHENVWHVWSQGGDYGTFTKKDDAIRQAERIVKIRVEATQIEACPPIEVKP